MHDTTVKEGLSDCKHFSESVRQGNHSPAPCSVARTRSSRRTQPRRRTRHIPIPLTAELSASISPVSTAWNCQKLLSSK